MKSPTVLLECLLDDFERLSPGVKGLDRDVITIKKRYEDEGDGFLTIALPSLDQALCRGLASRRFTCPPGFKKAKGKAIPAFLQGMLCKIFEPFTGLLLADPDLGVLKDVHTLLRCMKKVVLPNEREEKLHAEAVAGFYRTDKTASEVEIPSREDHLIGHVSRFILHSLHKKDTQDVTYKHGPGAVEEGFSSNQKWRELYESVGDDGPIPDWAGILDFYNPGRLVRNNLPQGPDLFSTNRSGSLQGANSDRDGLRDRQLRLGSARLISVAKNSTSRRTITIEPMLNMFLQQGLNLVLRDSIKECRVLGNCLALTDQSRNQILALEGSLTDEWATLDLKSASDLMSLKLVKSVFRYHPQFLEMMIDCRSSFVKCGDEPLLTLGKFAGMGNALTFPLQSVCFAVICIAAIHDVWGKKPTYMSVELASRQIRIYGDDIIVKREYANQVVTWLHQVGLMVNVEKSYLEGNFKESCGVDAFMGVDITPIYLGTIPGKMQTSASPSDIAGLIAASNHMWLQGLYKASTALKEHVESLLGERLPLVSSKSGALGWHTRQEAVTVHKYCRNLHKPLVRTFALATIKRRDRLDGYGALLKSLTTPLLGRSVDHLESTPIRFKHRLVRRWVPSLV